MNKRSNIINSIRKRAKIIVQVIPSFDPYVSEHPMQYNGITPKGVLHTLKIITPKTMRKKEVDTNALIVRSVYFTPKSLEIVN